LIKKRNPKQTEITINNKVKFKRAKMKSSWAQTPYALPRPEHNLHFTEKNTNEYALSV
jgi:hypothetical protein